MTYIKVKNYKKHIPSESIKEKLKKLEQKFGGRLGLSAIDTETRKTIGYRHKEKFPLCSTAKVMAVSAILKKAMRDKKLLKKEIFYTQKDLDKLGHCPITKKNLYKGTMTIEDLCEAAICYSDNAAMNFILKEIQGPKALTSYARSIGDKSFRLDRYEIELNTSIPGDFRDTTTPLAMQKSLRNLALGKILEVEMREKLQKWLKNNTTGDTKIKAGVPKNWTVGDKTGGGNYGTTNDIAILWPIHSSPIIIAIYYTREKEDAEIKNEIIALASSLLIDEFAMSNKKLKPI